MHPQYPWPVRSSCHADLLQARPTPASTIGAGGGLQTWLSSVKATAPTFVQACSILDLDSSRPVLELVPGTFPSNRPAAAVRTLKPWQVRILAWASPMEQSKLDVWLLADEMGLRKTVSALPRLICAHIEAKIKQGTAFEIFPGKHSRWSEQQVFDFLCAEGMLRTKFKTLIGRACLGHKPPFNGAQWLNGAAVVAVKDILQGMGGPKQHRKAVEPRNGLLDCFIARLQELEIRP